MKIGDNIRTQRIKNKMSQKELADHLGVSNQAVSSWERSRTEPNMEMIGKMSLIFDCQISDLVGEVPKTYTVVRSPRENYVINKFRDANENTKIMIERILSFVDKETDHDN